MPWMLSLFFADGFWIALPGGALYVGILEVWGDLWEHCPLRKPGSVSDGVKGRKDGITALPLIS